MNGIHDMGGMHGFGPIAPEANAGTFHADYEPRMFGLMMAVRSLGLWSIDRNRFTRESLPPADYLTKGYYEQLMEVCVQLLAEHGLISQDERRSGRPASDARPDIRATGPEAVLPLLMRGGPADRDVDVPPRFTVGSRVRGRNIHATGHVRLPRYARGRTGVVDRDHGVFVFADTNAHGLGECPQHLYSVRFEAAELWGAQANAGAAVYIDLWDDHLEPA